MTVSRRLFMAGAGAWAVVPAGLMGAAQATYKTKLHKALIAAVADDATCERLVKAGFAGMELTKKDVTIEQAEQGRRTAEKHGLKIHSFLVGWADFNNVDPVARRNSIEEVKRLIQVAAAYGAEAILLVPCRISGTMPKPTQFKIDYDPGTFAIKSVAAGDNSLFAEYIAAHNQATEMTRSAVEELIPVAVRFNVKIALENVWNNLWVLPDFAAAFIKSFRHEQVKAYLDLGNHVRYAPTEAWLRALGPNIAKLHMKDFKIDRAKKNDGDFVPLYKGSVDWKSVRQVVEEIGYNGWVTLESSGYTDQEHSALMERFFVE